MWGNRKCDYKGCFGGNHPTPTAGRGPPAPSAKGCSMTPAWHSQGLVPFFMTMLPERRGMVAHSNSAPAEYWALTLLPPFGTLRPCQGQSCLWNQPRVWRQSTSLLPSPAFLPLPQRLLTEQYPRHRQHTHESQNWATQATTSNYNARVCKEVSLKHSACKCKLGICLLWPGGWGVWPETLRDKIQSPWEKGIQPELGLTLCHLWPISW